MSHADLRARVALLEAELQRERSLRRPVGPDEVVRLLQPSVEPDGMPNWWHRSEPAMSEAKIREVFPFA